MIMKARLTIVFCCIINTLIAQVHHNFKPINIGISTKLTSKVLDEQRTINIYLPAGYNDSDTARYPVIYVPDGGVEEDFVHFAGLVQYSSQPWIGKFPRSILVGIENTNRQRDFTFPVSNLDFLAKVGFRKENIPQYGGSEKYINFLEHELQPYIREQFRTTGTTTVIGESLGGLLVTEIFAKHRQLFTNYIIISPSLWWGGGQLLKDLKAAELPGNGIVTKVYLGVPQKNEMPFMFTDAEQLASILRARKDTKLYFDYLPKETHATVSHQAVYNAFRLLYSK